MRVDEKDKKLQDYIFHTSFSISNSGVLSVKSQGWGTIVIPRELSSGVEVTSIADNAFKNNEDINSVFLPASIKMIGNSTFEGCGNFSTISIHKNLEKIGNYAFESCSS